MRTILRDAVADVIDVHPVNIEFTCSRTDKPVLGFRRRLHYSEAGSRGMSKRFPSWHEDPHAPGGPFDTFNLDIFRDALYETTKPPDPPRTMLQITIYAPAAVGDIISRGLQMLGVQNSIRDELKLAWGSMHQRPMEVGHLLVFEVVPDLDRQCSCTGMFWPVCGNDGRSYANTCTASCIGVVIQHKGGCRPCIRTNGDLVLSAWKGHDNGPNWCNMCECIDSFFGCTRHPCLGTPPPHAVDNTTRSPTPTPTPAPQAPPTWGRDGVGFEYDDVPPAISTDHGEYDDPSRPYWSRSTGLDHIGNLMAWSVVAFPALLAGRRMVRP